jgi:hypothetical protein
MANPRDIGNSATSPRDLVSRLVDAGFIGKDTNKDDVQTALDAYNEKRLGNATTGKKDDNGGNRALTFTRDLLKASEAGNYFSSRIEDELMNVDSLFDTFFEQTANGGLKLKEKLKASSIIDGVFLGISGATIAYQKLQTFLLDEINEKTSLTGQLSKDYRDEITRAQPELLRLGISTGDLAKSAAKLITDSGRFNLINRETFERAGAVAKAFVGTLEDLVSMYPEFEKIGLGAIDATEAISRAGNKSLQLGLNSKKVISELQTNIKQINEYGFKNGIDGLVRMQQKAIEFRMSMDSVFKIAEKVMQPEGAIDLAANLQVLGGAIGDFNDPLKLMYMSTNNVEGLQDALIKAAGGLATYNSESKRFELTGVNLRRAREMATQLGINYEDLAKGAISAAQKTSAASALMARSLTLKPEQEEFLTNIAQMKDGKMQIELQSERLQSIFKAQSLSLENLTQEQVNTLLQYQKEFEVTEEKDIIRNQYTAVENIKRDLNFLVALARLEAGKGGELAASLIGLDLRELVVGGSDTVTNAIANEMKELADKLEKTLETSGVYDKQTQMIVDKINNLRAEKDKEQTEKFKKTQEAETKTSKVDITVYYDGASSNEHSKDFKMKKKGDYTNNENVNVNVN